MNFEEAYDLLESLNEGINDPGIFKAIFTAGGPGSGKSTVANKLGLMAMGLRPINSDTAFENALKKAGMSLKLDTVDPEVIDTMRVKAKQISNKQLDLALNGRLGLIIDSTARNTTRIAKQKDMLEKLGYETAMLFVDTKLDTALDRNELRPRSVPKAVVTKSHKEIQANKMKLKKLFGRNYWEIANDGDMKDLEKNTTKWFSKVKSWTKQLPGNKMVKDWIAKVKNMVREEEVISELDLRSPARRDKTRMEASLSANEKKLMKKMLANPKTAIRDLQITINVFKKQLNKATALTQPLLKAQIDKYEDWLKMLTPKGMIPVAEAFNDNQLEVLRKEYSKIKKVDPNGAVIKKLKKFIKGMNPENLKSLADAKPPVPWLSMLARFQLKEDVTELSDETLAERLNEEVVTTAAIPQGPESIGVKPDGKFAGNPVFDCDDATFSNCIKGKKKYGRWAAYLGKDNPFYSKMQSWMKQSYKNKNFMLRNQKSGAMVWARNPLGESYDPEKEAMVATKKVDASRKKYQKSLKKSTDKFIIANIMAYPKKDYISPIMLADLVAEIKARGYEFKSNNWVRNMKESRDEWLRLKYDLGMDASRFGRETVKKISKMKKSRFKNIPNPGSHIKSVRISDVRIDDVDNPMSWQIDFDLEFTGATSMPQKYSFGIAVEQDAKNDNVMEYKVLSSEYRGTFRMNKRDNMASVLQSLIHRMYDNVVLDKVYNDIKGFAAHYAKNPPRQPLPGAGRR